MRNFSAAEWVAAGLALTLTLGSVGYMVVKQGELTEAAKQGKENRLKNLDLPSSK